MALMRFRRSTSDTATAALADVLSGFSIEVMARTAANIADFSAILPKGTRVYVAHIAGTPIEDMAATVARLTREGMAPMPHVPARIIADRATLADWLARYRDAGARQALVLGGGVTQPVGAYHEAMQLLETGLFEGFERLHVAGHPEGNRDIDPEGGEARVMEALLRKQQFARDTGIDMAIATQFAFESQPIFDWTDRLAAHGITLPVHLGVAGPAKLQTMIKFAIACGVGPSLRVLQRRARDVTKLVMPFEPDTLLAEIAAHKAQHPDSAIAQVHFFPLGGITAATDWIARAAGR